MVELVSQLVYLAGVASGILIMYVLRKEKSRLALGIGAPPILLGLLFLLRSYGLLPATLVWTLGGSAILLLLWFGYVSTGRERSALLNFPIFLGWFALVLVALYVFLFPPVVLFVYTSLALAITHSFDLRGIDIRAAEKVMRGYSRALALPFSFVNERIRRQTRVPRMGLALFFGYLSFELILLLVVPTLVMVAFGSDVAFYILNSIMMGFILVARWEIGGASTDKGSSEREGN